jgi:hypothetical protein
MCLNLVPRINLYIHIYHDVMIMMAFVIYLSPQNALSFMYLIFVSSCGLETLLTFKFYVLGMSGSEFSESQVLITA